ncbi:sulfatase-like hydrolase/transferase [Halovivax limisalsi]|uniref:sulfatase-like hydrolase/transferase n=1 Tax=Halovivax limisalsi TaxID=1453760 RepID=UPI001FFCAC48|nr:sulfatase-like hydrolase/transferase [Halovivax limisalsi]
MNVKRTLIERLPPSVKRVLAIPYDWQQTRAADRAFAQKELPPAERDPDAPAHIVCLVVDALRADHVDAQLTPFLASLNGTDAITPSTWTFPAMSSFVTGVYPHEHGAMKQSDEPDDSSGLSLPPRMAEDRTTLTETLAGAGYETYGGFGHDTPFVALSGRFETHELYHSITANADDVLSDHVNWLAGRERTFSLVHLADPHVPVDPPTAYWESHEVDRSIEAIENWRYGTETECADDCRRYREHRRRLYRAAIDYVDDAIERYVARLDETIDEDYALLVTADHGEALWEHVDFDVTHFDGTGCVDHGGAPYDELARVPLLTNRQWEVDAPVSLVDVAPTILDSVGVTGPHMSGVSLRGDAPAERRLLVEGSLSGYEKKAVYDGGAKLVASRGNDVEVVLDSNTDEPIDVSEDRLESMRESLPPWPDGGENQTEVPEVVEDRLAQLGYR